MKEREAAEVPSWIRTDSAVVQGCILTPKPQGRCNFAFLQRRAS